MRIDIDLSKYKHSCTVNTRWKDIDQFGHVNNAVYLTYLEVSRFHYCQDINNWDWNKNQFIIASISVNYLRPIFFPEVLKVYQRISDIGEKSFNFYYAITVERNGVEKICFDAKSTQVMYDLKNKKTIRIPIEILDEWKEFELDEHFNYKE